MEALLSSFTESQNSSHLNIQNYRSNLITIPSCHMRKLSNMHYFCMIYKRQEFWNF